MPIEVAPPKYVVIVNALQERITDGSYPPGHMLPSETELMREFHTSRPTVVRSLDLLRQQGWLEAHQGKGRFVIGAPARQSRVAGNPGYALLSQSESAGVTVLRAGLVPAPQRAATALGIKAGIPVIARQCLVSAREVGPIELGTAYVPVDLAAGTDAGSERPLAVGLLGHLSARTGVAFDHAAQRISARLPSAEEADLLDVPRTEPLISVLLTVYDQAGEARVGMDLVIPTSRHELEDVFPLT